MKRVFILIAIWFCFFGGRTPKHFSGRDLYWVDPLNLGGVWDASNTDNWAASEGGTPGEPAPDASDHVHITDPSGSSLIDVQAGAQCATLQISKYQGEFGGSGDLNVYGDGSSLVSINLSGIYSHTGTIHFLGSGTIEIRNSTTITSNFECNEGSSTFTVNNDFIMSATAGITLTAGDFEQAGYGIQLGYFYSHNSNSRILTNAGNTFLSGTGLVWDMLDDGLTYTAGTEIDITDGSATSKTFNGSNLNYAILHITGGGTGAIIMQGNNVFSGSFTYDYFGGFSPSILFTDGSTTTFNGGVAVSGSAGLNVILNTDTGSGNFSFSNGGGSPITLDRVTISHSSVSPTCPAGNSWFATNSTDGGNNSGWIFGASCPATGHYRFFF